MARTYVPKLRYLVRTLCTYLTRYADSIRATLDATGEAALDALQTACTNFLANVPPDEPTD